MAQIRVGVIGLGIGGKHIEAYASHPQCELIALCDFDKEKLQSYRESYPSAHPTRDATDVLTHPEIDLISIASFDNYHCEQVVTAIRNGKHVFVEKPLCLFRDEAQEIRSALQETPSLQISSNLNLRSCPRFIRVRREILSGEMGEIFYMEGDYLWGRAHKLLCGWRGKMPFYSIIHGAAVHMIDLIMWMTGMRPVEVHAVGNRICTKTSDFAFNDFAVMILRFENGMAAKISASGGCVHPHFHRVEIYGTRKTFFNDIHGGHLLDTTDPAKIGTRVTEPYPGAEEKAKVITSFVNSILDSSEEALVPGEDVMAATSVCLAAEDAVTQGKPIPVEYI